MRHRSEAIKDKVQKVMADIASRFKSTEDYAPRHTTPRTLLPSTIGTDQKEIDAAKKAATWSLVQKHRGTPTGAHYAASKIIEDTRDIIISQLSLFTDHCARIAAVPLSCGYGECDEHSTFLCMELMCKEDILPNKMVLADKRKFEDLKNKEQQEQSYLHTYVRINLPDGSALVADPFLHVTCLENEYLTHPTVQRYMQSFNPSYPSGLMAICTHTYAAEHIKGMKKFHREAIQAAAILKPRIATVLAKYTPFLSVEAEAKGEIKADPLLLREVAKKTIPLVATGIGSFGGPLGAAAGFLVGEFIAEPLTRAVTRLPCCRRQ